MKSWHNSALANLVALRSRFHCSGIVASTSGNQAAPKVMPFLWCPKSNLLAWSSPPSPSSYYSSVLLPLPWPLLLRLLLRLLLQAHKLPYTEKRAWQRNVLLLFATEAAAACWPSSLPPTSPPLRRQTKSQLAGLAARPRLGVGGSSGLTTTIDHLGCRLLTSHSPKVSRANVANRHHFSSIPSHTVHRPVSIFKTRNSTNVV